MFLRFFADAAPVIANRNQRVMPGFFDRKMDLASLVSLNGLDSVFDQVQERSRKLLLVSKNQDFVQTVCFNF